MIIWNVFTLCNLPVYCLFQVHRYLRFVAFDSQVRNLWKHFYTRPFLELIPTHYYSPGSECWKFDGFYRWFYNLALILKASPVEIDNACVSKKRAEKCGVIFDFYREPITLAETPVLIDQLVGKVFFYKSMTKNLLTLRPSCWYELSYYP